MTLQLPPSPATAPALAQRAEALIAVAHPDHRDDLRRAASGHGLLGPGAR